MKRARILVVSLVALMLIAPASVSAITVNATDDAADPAPDDALCDVDTVTSGEQCTLRAAIQTAEGTAHSGADTIDFAPALGPTITLVSETPVITEELTVTGPGASSLTVDGDEVADWIFNANTTSATVRISGLTITGGSASDGRASGVRNQSGTMILDGVVITSNTGHLGTLSAVTQGGGVFNTGTMEFHNSTISDNFATAVAGSGASPLAVARGGGIYNETGAGESLLVRRTTVEGNTATATIASGSGTATNFARGGGIQNTGSSDLTLDRVTVSGNSATSFIGGGVGGTATAHGGGVDDQSDALIQSSTITANVATAQGVGVAGANLSPTATTAIHNTIIAAPTVGTNCAAAGGASSFSIESPGNTCGLVGSGDQVSVPDANLDLDPNLAANGGPTLTHKLLPGSVAIDQGKANASAAVGETTDQRGQPRPSQFLFIDATGGDGSDVGAYEVRAPLPQFTSIEPGASGSDDTPTLHGIVPDDGTNPSDSDVALFTDPACNNLTGIPSGEGAFATPGITASPVAHNATTTFYANGENAYGTSACSSGPFPGTITYTQQDPPSATPTPTPAATENPECVTLRETLKRLNRKIKRTDDREKKAKLKKKRRKVRQRLTALGCAA